MTDIEKMTDEELTETAVSVARTMSRYNAAEGRTWHNERTVREATSRRLKAVREELTKRGLPIPKSGQ